MILNPVIQGGAEKTYKKITILSSSVPRDEFPQTAKAGELVVSKSTYFDGHVAFGMVYTVDGTNVPTGRIPQNSTRAPSAQFYLYFFMPSSDVTFGFQ